MQKHYFEYVAARFVSEIAVNLPKEIMSLAFSSPLSARSPDLCMLWHTGYFYRHKLKLFFDNLLAAIVSFLKIPGRLLAHCEPFAYALYGRIDNTILVVPSICGQAVADGDYITNYVRKTREDGVFIFGSPRTCGRNETKVQELSIKLKLYYTFSLAKAGFSAYFRLGGGFFDSTILLLHWLAWILRFNWLRDYYLETTLSELIERFNIRKIGCIHEMHSYSRIVWRVAEKWNSGSYTVQHAAVTSGKRWYFYYQKEKESGLRLPSVMYMYNKNIIDRLKPYFNGTIFRLGCSSRYVHWRSVQRSSNKGSYYLFVGALAGFDNEVLLDTIKRLLIDMPSELLPIRIRLHPFAILNRKLKRWLESNVKIGKVQLSKDIVLKDDLNNAKVVIGMSTTVLEEALLLGRPTIQLTHHDFLKYIDINGINGAMVVDHNNLSIQDLLNISNTEVDSEAMRERLGLNYPEVTYQQLFS